MSENITHTAICDDCLRLLLASPEVCDAFKVAAREQRDFARLGGVTRKGDDFTIPLLTTLRQRWPQRQPGDRLDARLAFVLGWLSHRAADRQMKPLFRQVEPDRRLSPPETSVYHDAFIFHEVFNHGRTSPYHPHLFQDDLGDANLATNVDVDQTAALIQLLVQRALVELHTLIPDGDDIEGWLDRLFARVQQFKVDRHRYARAIADPDPDWVRRAITEVNFYDRDEPILTAARRLQHGESIAEDALLTALRTAPQSHYAQALRLGYDYLTAASAFFTGNLTADALADRLMLHQPGRDGLSV